MFIVAVQIINTSVAQKAAKFRTFRSRGFQFTETPSVGVFLLWNQAVFFEYALALRSNVCFPVGTHFNFAWSICFLFRLSRLVPDFILVNLAVQSTKKVYEDKIPARFMRIKSHRISMRITWLFFVLCTGCCWAQVVSVKNFDILAQLELLFAEKSHATFCMADLSVMVQILLKQKQRYWRPRQILNAIWATREARGVRLRFGLPFSVAKDRCRPSVSSVTLVSVPAVD